MNIIMHMGLAQAIRQATERELSLRIDRVGFLYGNVAPDIRPGLTNIPHYKSSAMDFLEAEIVKITSYPLPTTGKWPKQLSERMGIMTHYLADFFCYAHSQYFQGDLRAHLFYESRLWYDFQRHQKAVKHNWIKPDKILSSAENIITYIEERHDWYLDTVRNKHPSYHWDTATAFSVSVSVCVSMLSICIKNLKIAA